MRIGDIVKPLNDSNRLAFPRMNIGGSFQLHSGCGRYPKAIVAKVKPFTLISEGGDMEWTEIDPKWFGVTGRAKRNVMVAVRRRLARDKYNEKWVSKNVDKKNE